MISRGLPILEAGRGSPRYSQIRVNITILTLPDIRAYACLESSAINRYLTISQVSHG
ncbi:hypothetical protein MPLB_1760050 [Mesorhizobium sp. ORS 3324]|nr:hypothetical protein MPLB_1760050 [Mesorhizobium sp. ORS 3324]